MRTSILRFERLVNSIGGKTISKSIKRIIWFERLVNSIGGKTDCELLPTLRCLRDLLIQ